MNWVCHENYVRLWGKLRPDQGAKVIKALERGAHLIGRNPEGEWDSPEQRSADALTELCSRALAQDQDSDRATVVIHADASALVAEEGVAVTEEGVALSSEALRRTLCDCRLQLVAHDHDGAVTGTGRTYRSPSRWLVRRLRDRDQGCVFLGCNRRRFLQAHHVRHWVRGGETESHNLCLLCGYHHHLMHEGGWNMTFDGTGPPLFFRPTGEVFEPAPEPLWDELFGR
ncbi:MAG TPA: DUF222 domain-containing protein, partial [Actinomycetota bacterium]|nr:DUF222 domain-containing protein [Actinomycetota bacterium]